VHEYFAIASASEGVAAAQQFAADIGGAVEFPVHDGDDRPVLALNRLSSRLRGIDDRKTLMPEANALSSPDAACLGATVSEGVKLTVEGIHDRGPIGVLEVARKTAHRFRSPSVPWRVRGVVYYPRLGEPVALIGSET
jgi:hypothetical protein